MPQPFEVAEEEVLADLDSYVDEVFATLESQFLTLPRGDGFVEERAFETGYEELKRTTQDFTDVTPSPIIEAVYRVPVSLIVLRTMLGFTPPEWAYVTGTHLGIDISQGAARSIDRQIRLAPLAPIESPTTQFASRVRALIETACYLLQHGPPNVPRDVLHRLDKADTAKGLDSIRRIALDGVPYSTLLYERFLGRPLAAHRDSVSDLVGDVLEDAIEAVLAASRIRFHKTRRAERIDGFDQAPDFLIPTSATPGVVVEAKITEDDGTARDKVTRVQHLDALSRANLPAGAPRRFEVVACIAGRGFRVRREDMKKLLLATGGKVFTLANVDRLVYHTRVGDFAE